MDKLTTSFKEYLYERLKESDAVVGYLNAALEGDSYSSFLLALRYVAEARGISKVAELADLNRENLYRILSDQGNPRLSSMLALLEAVGVQLQVKPLGKEAVARQTRNKLRPILAAVNKGYIAGLEDEHDTADKREPEPAAA